MNAKITFLPGHLAFCWGRSDKGDHKSLDILSCWADIILKAPHAFIHIHRTPRLILPVIAPAIPQYPSQ